MKSLVLLISPRWPLGYLSFVLTKLFFNKSESKLPADPSDIKITQTQYDQGLQADKEGKWIHANKLLLYECVCSKL